MANRSYQTITLYGKPEKVKEVLECVLSQKEIDFEDGFGTKVFPISLCSIKDDKIYLETRYASVGFDELSKSFPEVGFMSSSWTENCGQELFLMINGHCIYEVYYNCEEMYMGDDQPNTWELVTGLKLNDKNICKAFNLIEKGVA
jgi:hypothetical protein